MKKSNVIKNALLASILVSSCASASQLNIGLGYGPQVGKHVDKQNNSVFDVSYTFHKQYFGDSENWEFLLGVGYSHLATDVDFNQRVDVYSVLPTIRYNLEKRNNYDPYIGFTAGPSIMSSKKLGYQEQGSTFLFNDFITVGAYLGDKRDWEVSFSWRHLSNANFFPPNPGFDVPFSFSIGKKF